MYISNLSLLASLWYIWKRSLTFSILHLVYLIKSNNWINKIESNSSILCAQKAALKRIFKKDKLELVDAHMQYFIEFLKSTQIWMVEGEIF